MPLHFYMTWTIFKRLKIVTNILFSVVCEIPTLISEFLTIRIRPGLLDVVFISLLAKRMINGSEVSSTEAKLLSI